MDTILESLVRVLRVAKVQSFNIKSATSSCTRLSQSVRRMHKSARSLNRRDQKDHRNSLVTNPTAHAENCSSWAKTHSTQASRNGQWWEQTDPDALRAWGRRHQQSVGRKDKTLLSPHLCGISILEVQHGSKYAHYSCRNYLQANPLIRE